MEENYFIDLNKSQPLQNFGKKIGNEDMHKFINDKKKKLNDDKNIKQ